MLLSIRFLLFLIWFSQGNQTPGVAEDEYFLAKNEDGIQVYNKKKPKAGFIEYRARMMLPGKTLREVLDLFSDYTRHPQWVYNCTEAHITMKQGTTRLYQVIHSPWPYRDRDLSLRVRKTTLNPNTVVVTFDAEPGLAPETKKYVRIDDFTSKWIVRKTKNAVSITVDTSFDPKLTGGILFLKSYAVKIPFETFKDLRNLLETEK